MRKALLLLMVAALCAACGGVSGRVKAVYGGEANWAAVQAPDSVTAYRVISPGVLKHVRAPDTIGGFEIIAGPVTVDAASAKEFAAIAADESTYDFERAKGCEFEPGVALRFVKGPAKVDVLLCFHCDELAAFEGDKRVGGEDFDRSRPRLLALAKRLFPGDDKIQSLK